MKLPSQIDATSVINQLDELEKSGEINSPNFLSLDEVDCLPNSSSSWIVSQLKGAFDIKTPKLFPFPNSSKELFSWVERNNQIAEESLRGLLLEEGKIESIKESLSEYSEEIPSPKQITLQTPTPIDKDFLIESGDSEELNLPPSCFLWQWEKFCAFIAPQEFDFSQIENFYPELNKLNIQPDAFILMPYSENPLKDIDESLGNELWHNFPPQYPLFWEETKMYLEALRCLEAMAMQKTINQSNKTKKLKQ